MPHPARTISLVTGAGAGIGAAIAANLAERGDLVICADVDGDGAARTAAALPDAVPAQLDVRDEAATETLVDDVVRRHGRLDVAVVNAGVYLRKKAVDLSEDELELILDVNVRGAFLTARTAGRAMIAAGTGGSIVFIGSIHSVRAMPLQSAYAASKGAVRMMSNVLALEWARHGIRVNCVAPGFTETAVTAPTRADPERLEAMLRRVPMRRPGQPAEIAAPVRFLTSDEASFVTGAYLTVDGGWLTS